MRFLPFKTLMLCVLLPPLVYVVSIQMLETIFRARYDQELENRYIGDTAILFDGALRLQEALRKNIDAFIAERTLIRWGAKIEVTVKTPDGIYLYPFVHAGDFTQDGGTDRIAAARENYRLLSLGLIKTVNVKIQHNTLVSNALLSACVIVALGILVRVYRRAALAMDREQQNQHAKYEDLAQQHSQSRLQLARLESQRVALSKKMEKISGKLADERQRASSTEDEMIDELVALETKLAENRSAQDQQVDQISRLEERVRQYEKERENRARLRTREVENVRKRFDALYKNTCFHQRALEGLVELTEEMKIKAEEVVHQLNANPGSVPIKRKVFGKKNRETVLEIIFAYKGRLYFRRMGGQRIEVLVIGTKLTQGKDLAFLDKL